MEWDVSRCVQITDCVTQLLAPRVAEAPAVVAPRLAAAASHHNEDFPFPPPISLPTMTYFIFVLVTQPDVIVPSPADKDDG